MNFQIGGQKMVLLIKIWQGFIEFLTQTLTCLLFNQALVASFNPHHKTIDFFGNHQDKWLRSVSNWNITSFVQIEGKFFQNQSFPIEN